MKKIQHTMGPFLAEKHTLCRTIDLGEINNLLGTTIQKGPW